MKINIPLNWLSLKYRYADWKDLDVESRQKLIWPKNCVIEFWMDGFNDDGLDKAFKHIVAIYDKVLYKDPQWHYFYEDTYSLIRCSYKHCYEVKRYLDEHGIKYKWPVGPWKETLNSTKIFQETFKEMFHSFSVLVIEMFKKDCGCLLYESADRVCHCFHNHAMYLASAEGELDEYENIDPMAWEAMQMAKLTALRAYHIGGIGMYKGIKKLNGGKQKEALANSE